MKYFNFKKLTALTSGTLCLWSGILVIDIESYADQYSLQASQFHERLGRYRPIPELTPEKISEPIRRPITTFTPLRPQLEVFPDFNISREMLVDLTADSTVWKYGTVVPETYRDIEHQVSESGLRDQGIKELLSVGYSEFLGSDGARIHNVLRAVELYDGQIIRQGETFSFNEILQDATWRNGFKKAKVILNGSTAYGWGGGICQVSTTIFRSAFNAGLPIDARRNHTYPVKYYEPQGLDATIYLGQQDLKFTNDTPGDLMLQLEVDVETRRLWVMIYGTSDRYVHIDPAYAQGYSYGWRRSIVRDGEADVQVLKSWYQPERKVEVVMGQ